MALIEEAIVDAHKRTAFSTMLDEYLDVPFDARLLGATATVERVDMTSPPPSGAEWIEPYRCWATGE